MSRDYLTTADVLGLHAILLERYGGASGIRDMGALESSVYRPQCGYYADIVEEACALMESLLINHPFVDGNKRTAFAAFDVFLRINGKRLNGFGKTLYPDHTLDRASSLNAITEYDARCATLCSGVNQWQTRNTIALCSARVAAMQSNVLQSVSLVRIMA